MFGGIWAVVGFSDAEYVSVPVLEARLIDDWVVELLVDSCNGAPSATFSLGAEHVEVEVRAFRLKSSGDSCLDLFEVHLPESVRGSSPPTELRDLHTSEVVMIVDSSR